MTSEFHHGALRDSYEKTKEEAIHCLTTFVELRRNYCVGQVWEDEIQCLEMAIEALKQELCDDCISRKAAIDCVTYDVEYTIECLKALPPVVPQPNNVLDKIKTEIKKAIWEDVIVSLDGTDETRIPRLNPDDVLEIIDKYKSENKE